MPRSECHLVLLRTSANQGYIFDTNRLRENIGASELIVRAGTGYVLDHVAPRQGRSWCEPESPTVRHDWLRDATRNPPIARDDVRCEVVTAASGEAMLLVASEDDGRQIVEAVTRRALCEAAGLNVRGIVHGPITFAERRFGEHVRAARDRLAALEGLWPAAELGFLRLPFTRPCLTSGLPAAMLYAPPEREGEPPSLPQPVSHVANAKGGYRERDRFDARTKGWARILAALGTTGPRLFQKVDELLAAFGQGEGPTAGDRAGVDWLGVIHADGNGLGQIFKHFERYVGSPEDRDYIDAFRRFSIALDAATVEAFRRALETLAESRDKQAREKKQIIAKPLPVVPLVLGGDDLTLICDGRDAVWLARDFLREFEMVSGAEPDITRIAGSGLTACAGVAIVKPHYPFHAAYRLAEDLLKQAKQVKQRVRRRDQPRPCSALDFHVHYDRTGRELAPIRAQLTHRVQANGTDELVRLFARPYVVSQLKEPELAGVTGLDWLRPRTVDRLEVALDELRRAREPDEDGLSMGLLHLLRDALHEGRDVAEAHHALLRDRCDTKQLAATLGYLEGERATEEEAARRDVFFVDAAEDGPRQVWSTRLLDAMDLAGL